jgi:hypothetical protein
LAAKVKALAASIKPTSVHSLPIHYYIAPVLWGLSDAENRCPEAAGRSWRMCAGHPVPAGFNRNIHGAKADHPAGLSLGGHGHAHPSI